MSKSSIYIHVSVKDLPRHYLNNSFMILLYKNVFLRPNGFLCCIAKYFESFNNSLNESFPALLDKVFLINNSQCCKNLFQFLFHGPENVPIFSWPRKCSHFFMAQKMSPFFHGPENVPIFSWPRKCPHFFLGAVLFTVCTFLKFISCTWSMSLPHISPKSLLTDVFFFLSYLS